jgi:hypothetical protein
MAGQEFECGNATAPHRPIGPLRRRERAKILEEVTGANFCKPEDRAQMYYI